MKGYTRIYETALVNLATIEDRLDTFKASLDAEEFFAFKFNDDKFKVNGVLTTDHIDELEALFTTDEEAANDDVGNTTPAAKLHRAHKQSISAINSVADPDTKAALQKMHKELHLLHRE